jgi:YhcH/YjgK/YiaL family protein
MIFDNISNANLYKKLDVKIKQAFEYIENTDFTKLDKGKYEIDGENIYLLVNQYQTKCEINNVLESHKRYIDLQYMVSGSEIIDYESFSKQEVFQDYNIENDFILYNSTRSTKIVLDEGLFAIFFPNDLHMPGLANETPLEVKKIVIKILLHENNS